MLWLGTLLSRSPADLIQQASHIKVEATTPLFLPHLVGERAPIWDTASRGVFARLTADNGPEQLTLSVMEGVAHSVRWAFEALEQSARFIPQRINISGGGARSDAWCQIRADVLGKPLTRTSIPAAAALGAAMSPESAVTPFHSFLRRFATLVASSARSTRPEPARLLRRATRTLRRAL